MTISFGAIHRSFPILFECLNDLPSLYLLPKNSIFTLYICLFIFICSVRSALFFSSSIFSINLKKKKLQVSYVHLRPTLFVHICSLFYYCYIASMPQCLILVSLTLSLISYCVVYVSLFCHFLYLNYFAIFFCYIIL